MEKISVDPETMRVTTSCEADFSCLRGGEHGLCEIADCVDGNLHFLQCAHTKACAYQSPFGSVNLCSCPTRKEIHAKYQR